MSEFDDIARELHAMRSEPRPEYARELDRRAAGWLRERPRRRLPSLRVAPTAATAAAAAARSPGAWARSHSSSRPTPSSGAVRGRQPVAAVKAEVSET